MIGSKLQSCPQSPRLTELGSKQKAVDGNCGVERNSVLPVAPKFAPTSRNAGLGAESYGLM